jgi:hypothetical protein
MNDVTEKVSKSTTVKPGIELIWDKIRASVVLFLHGEPLSFYPLDGSRNNEEGAVTVGAKLVNGEGQKF